MSNDFQFVLSADEVQTIRIGLNRYIDEAEHGSEDWNDAQDVWQVIDAGAGKYRFSDLQVDIVLNSLDYVGSADDLFCRIFNERNEQVGA